MFFSGKVNLILAVTVMLGTTLLILVHSTDVCRLEAVTLNGERIDDWSNRYGLRQDNSLFRQPLDSLAEDLISEPQILKVDISYSLPHRVDVRTNDFEPVCFLLDASTGKLFGLDRKARTIPLERIDIDWEHPVLTSVNARKLFSYCDDVRANVVVRQLEQLRRENIDLYRLIDEIDFADRGFLKVAISGLPYRLKVRAEYFLKDVDKFVEFVSRFAPDLEGVTMLDTRCDGMIICAGEKK